MRLTSIAVILALLSLVIITGCNGNSVDYTEFAKCLSDNGAKMYGTDWCSHCKKQKDAFGSAFNHIKFVDCDLLPDECKNAGVENYPTWIIDGTLHTGSQSFEDLSELTGCSLPAIE